MSKEEKQEISGDFSKEMEALQIVLGALRPLDSEARERLIKSVTTFFGIDMATHLNIPITPAASSYSRLATYKVLPTFSENRSMSPKEFILQKQPRTDVERVACLAYYLTHYRETPHFKTLEISKLNTEAAQLKLSNAAKSVGNATTYGYLVPATKGQKQLSAGGELFVQALPDRPAARDAMAQARPRRKTTLSSKKKAKQVK